MSLFQYYKPTRSLPPLGGAVRESSFAQSTAASTNPQGTMTGKHTRYDNSDITAKAANS